MEKRKGKYGPARAPRKVEIKGERMRMREKYGRRRAEGQWPPPP